MSVKKAFTISHDQHSCMNRGNQKLIKRLRTTKSQYDTSK